MQRQNDESYEMGVDKIERKRQREKKRRSDLAYAFSELSSLLSRILPEGDVDSGSTSKPSGTRRSPAAGEMVDYSESGEASGLPRCELVTKATEIISQMYAENKSLRERLSQSPGDSGPNKPSEILVMVPTLRPIDMDTSEGSTHGPPQQNHSLQRFPAPPHQQYPQLPPHPVHPLPPHGNRGPPRESFDPDRPPSVAPSFSVPGGGYPPYPLHPQARWPPQPLPDMRHEDGGRAEYPSLDRGFHPIFYPESHNPPDYPPPPNYPPNMPRPPKQDSPQQDSPSLNTPERLLPREND